MEQGKLTIKGMDAVEQTISKVQYSKKAGWHYILYQETNEGFETYSTRIKCGDGYLEMVRKGKQEIRMVYEQGKEYCTFYPTPYGAIELKISTSKVTLEETSNQITILVECSIGGNPPQNMTILLKKESLSINP